MQIPTLVRRGRTGFNMTPMIDVVFLLIIFFLVASHLSEQDTQVEIDLPRSARAQPQLRTSKNRLTVNVPQTDRILVAGEFVTLEQLHEILQEHLDNGLEEVRIRTGRNVVYETIDPILSTCADVGIWNVTFAVREKGER